MWRNDLGCSALARDIVIAKNVLGRKLGLRHVTSDRIECCAPHDDRTKEQKNKKKTDFKVDTLNLQAISLQKSDMVRHNRQPFAFGSIYLAAVMCFPHFSLDIHFLRLLTRRADARFSFSCSHSLAPGDVVVVVVAQQWLSGSLLSQSLVFFCVWPLTRWRRRLKVCGGRRGIPRKKPPNDDDVAGKKCTTLAVVTVVLYIFVTFIVRYISNTLTVVGLRAQTSFTLWMCVPHKCNALCILFCRFFPFSPDES